MPNNLLIDSHVLIWLIYEPERIGPRTTKLLEQAEMVFVSSASLWELALKHSKNKLAYSPKDLAGGTAALALERLDIKDKHLAALEDIKLAQSDPFDQMITAQAVTENFIVVTVDQNLLKSEYQTFNARS